MSYTPEEIQSILHTIIDKVSNADLTEPEALNECYEQVGAFIDGLSPDISGAGIARLLKLCHKGLDAFSRFEMPARKDLLQAIGDALSVCERFLSGEDDETKRQQIRAAGQHLDRILNQQAAPEKKDLNDSMDAEEFLSTLLNEAAALVVQMEPEDIGDLKKLCSRLEAASTDATYPDCNEIVEEALLKVGRMIRMSTREPDYRIDLGELEPVGRMIASALEIISNPETAVLAEASAGGEPKNFMPDDADIELISAFIAESGDLITGAEDALLDLETMPEDNEAVSTVFRAFHNIKGTSAFFELGLMTELAHHAESLLSQVRDGAIRYAGGYPDLALRSIDMLKELFIGLQGALDGAAFTKPAGYDELLEILADPEAVGITDAPASDAQEAEISDVPALEPDSDFPTENFTPTPDPSPEPVAKPPVPLPKSSPAKAVTESSIRVPISRLDRFIDTVGELVVSHSMVTQDETVTGGGHHELQKKVAQTSKIVRELQTMSMSMRMIPLKTTFRKMARLVRDLSRKIGKDIVFVAEGEDTEIDRNMVDIINDPLVHMVRNAIDHGIEYPDMRKKMGKPPHGTIHLSAYHSAGNVVVEIRDDGCGLDRDAILNKARSRGLLEEREGLSERDVYNLIFEPGFSTAQNVSDVSGRGVGMDVVKRNIESVRGQVEIQSEYGEGAVFKMSLPLTLAIIDGMVVRVGREKYVIPTISIVRSVQPSLKDVTLVLNKGEMLKLQNRLVPLFRLATLFEIEEGQTDLESSIAVIVENDGQQAGVIVDELIGSQQIVIKTLGEMLGNIIGISGSAIMPNGRVGLILDVGGLVKLAHMQDDRRVEDEPPAVIHNDKGPPVTDL